MSDSKTNPHTVTVSTILIPDEDTGGEKRVIHALIFACSAEPEDDCRRHPECDCDVWRWDETGDRDEEGHERTPGHECWLKGWFDAPCHVYTGSDFDDMRDDCVPAVDRSGPITDRFIEEVLEWKFEEVSDV